MSMGSSKEKIILQADLKAFFYEKLLELNNCTHRPLTQETLFYSSLVLERYCKSEFYFDFEDGRVKEKLLGIKLLQSQSLPNEEKKRELKDVGETALILCGYFPPSINRKFSNPEYYESIGKSAFKYLNDIEPVYMDVPSFYEVLSFSFGNVVNLLNRLSLNLADTNKNFDKYPIFKLKKTSN
jgi:hypothetical protein